MNPKSVTRPICVIGGSGQIGERLVRLCRERERPVVATYYRHARPGLVPLDATDAAQVETLLEETRPWLVINSLNAKGGTDACEAEPALARRAHFETARNLADAAARVGAHVVQISTDYVFDGKAGPYAEDNQPAPISQLGKAKLEAERYVLERWPENLVVRTSCVFSWTPQSVTKNFVMQLLENDRRSLTMRVPYDQVGNITYAPNVAEALLELVERGAAGVFHLAGTTRCSKYEWAVRVVNTFGLQRDLIQGVSTEELGQRGPRPLSSGFRLDKAQATLRRTSLMSLDEGLADMAREISAAHTAVAAA